MMSFIKVLEDFDNIHSLITLLYKLQKEAGGENFLGGGKNTPVTEQKQFISFPVVITSSTH